MRHVGDHTAATIDRASDRLGQLFKLIRQGVFFGRCLVRRGPRLGLRCNMTVGVESPDGAVALLETLPAFFEKRLDVLDQLLLVQFFLWCAFSFFDALQRKDPGLASSSFLNVRRLTYLGDHSADWLNTVQRLADDAAHLLR